MKTVARIIQSCLQNCQM